MRVTCYTMHVRQHHGRGAGVRRCPDTQETSCGRKGIAGRSNATRWHCSASSASEAESNNAARAGHTRVLPCRRPQTPRLCIALGAPRAARGPGLLDLSRLPGPHAACQRGRECGRDPGTASCGQRHAYRDRLCRRGTPRGRHAPAAVEKNSSILRARVAGPGSRTPRFHHKFHVTAQGPSTLSAQTANRQGAPCAKGAAP